MHWLIVGQTLSGKTTLAKRLAQQYRDKGISVVVLDPMRDPGWPEDAVQFSASDAFLAYVRDPRQCLQCALFVDESGSAIDKHDVTHQWLTTTSRHHGHVAHLIAQRAEQVNRTTRSQCATIACFSVNARDAKEYALDFNCDALLEAPALPRGAYLLARRFAPVERLRLW